MNISQEKVDDLNALLKVQLTEEDYKDKVDKVLKDYRKNANIPGFRKGQVPMGIIKKKVGTSALVEEINKILSDNLHKYITENELDILGNPLPKLDQQEKIDWENQTNFEFVYEVGLSPQFEVEISDKIKFDKYVIKASDDVIEKQITDLRKRYGKMTNPEVAEQEDMLYGKFNELEGEEIKAGGINHSSVIIIDAVTDKKLQKELVGKKPGDVIDLDPKKVSENESDQAAAIGVKVEELKNITSKFRFTVEKINRMIPAELNQDFFDKLFGPDAVKTEKELKEKVKEELEKGLVLDSDKKLRADIQDSFMKKLKLDLPNDFLKKWIKASNEKPISDEQIEAEYDQYAKGLKWQLIENKIIKDNDIKVEHEEVIDYTKGLLTQQMANMGMPSGDDKELTETAHRVLQNEQEARNIYANLYDSKLMELYKSNFKLKEKEIDYDSFIELVNK